MSSISYVKQSLFLHSPTDSIRYSREQDEALDLRAIVETEVDSQTGIGEPGRSTTLRAIPNVLYTIPMYVTLLLHALCKTKGLLYPSYRVISVLSLLSNNVLTSP